MSLFSTCDSYNWLRPSTLTRRLSTMSDYLHSFWYVTSTQNSLILLVSIFEWAPHLLPRYRLCQSCFLKTLKLTRKVIFFGKLIRGLFLGHLRLPWRFRWGEVVSLVIHHKYFIDLKLVILRGWTLFGVSWIRKQLGLLIGRTWIFWKTKVWEEG